MIVGTAGHVDHGKSALVSALTGRAMDRLAEERRRGITIELNFAPLVLPGLGTVGFVDVPGHEDFVRTMVAGASGIDCVLLVVDAQQGIQPQTLEHLAIVEQLGIPAGIPVLTKADLVEEEWLALVRDDLAARLDRSPIRFSEPVVTSAVTGAGIAALREQIGREMMAVAPGTRAADLVRLPVDRAFAVAGAGTVVTGTLWSGTVRTGDQVRIEPGGLQGRVRTLEQFGTPVDAAGPGARTAIGLAGIALEDVHRGQVVLGGDVAWPATDRLDVLLSLLPEAPRALEGRTRIRFHLGTAEVMARAYPRAPILPGASGLARLILDTPVIARGGDRFVLRSYSPVGTIGGGRVVDPEPPRRGAWPVELASSDPETHLAALVTRQAGGRLMADLDRLTGLTLEAAGRLVDGLPGLRRTSRRIIPAGEFEAAEMALLEAVRRFHRGDPAAPGMSVETLRQSLGAGNWLAEPAIEALLSAGKLRLSGGTVAVPGHTPKSIGGAEEVGRLVARITEAGLEPPTTQELSALGLTDLPGALRIAVAEGLLQPVERDRHFSTPALTRFREAVVALGQGGAEVTPAALRDRLGLSRKFLIPLLEWADRTGITWRDTAGTRRLRPTR